MNIKLIFQIIRWPNLGTIALTFALFWWVTNPVLAYPDTLFWVLFSGTLLIAAAGYLINDLYDIDTDRINRPQKVWLGTVVKPQTAVQIYTSLNSLALLLVLLCFKWSLLVFFGGAMFLLLAYAKYFKRLPFIGNFVVAFLCALVVLQYWYFYQHSMLLIWQDLLLFYALFAFYATLAREIIKDLEDLKGDRQAGCKTLAIVFGNRIAEYAVIACCVALITLLMALLFCYLTAVHYILYIYGFIALTIPLLGFVFGLMFQRHDWTTVK